MQLRDDGVSTGAAAFHPFRMPVLYQRLRKTRVMAIMYYNVCIKNFVRSFDIDTV
jgi:hypothetical protein